MAWVPAPGFGTVWLWTSLPDEGQKIETLPEESVEQVPNHLHRKGCFDVFYVAAQQHFVRHKYWPYCKKLYQSYAGL